MLLWDIIVYIYKYQLKSLTHTIYLYFTQGKQAAKDYRDNFFADLFQAWSVEFNHRTKQYKEELFCDLKDVKSKDPVLAQKGKIRILEIGIGPGANIGFYPSNCHIIAVDPNQHYEEIIKKNMRKFPDMKLEKFVAAGGEDMEDVDDESIDVVVTTIVHCSVKSSEKVLSEIRRVLVAGGRYYYMEHILDDQSTWNYLRQQFFTWTHFWQVLFDNCHFMKKDKLLSNGSYLNQVWNRKFHLDKSGLWIYQIISPHMIGVDKKCDL